MILKPQALPLIRILISLLLIGLIVSSTLTWAHVTSQSQTWSVIEETRNAEKALSLSFGQAGHFSNAHEMQRIAQESNGRGNWRGNPWGGDYEVKPSDTNAKSFSITMTHVPMMPCIEVSKQLSLDFQDIRINGQAVESTLNGLSQVKILCQSNFNTVALTSKPLGKDKLSWAGFSEKNLADARDMLSIQEHVKLKS